MSKKRAIATRRRVGNPQTSAVGATRWWKEDQAEYLRRAILAVAVFTLFAPLFVNPDFYFPFVFLKSMVFRSAVLLLALLYVALAALARRYRPRWSPFIVLVLVYFAAQLLSTIESVSPWTSWWGGYARMSGMISQLYLLAYFLVLAHVFRRLRDWIVLFAALLFGGVLMGFSGLVQKLDLGYLYSFRPDVRIKGAAGNANFFAAFLVLNFLVTLWLLARKDRNEVYPVVASTWLGLVLTLDASLLAWGIVTGTLNTGLLVQGLSIPAVAGFVVLLHAITLLWFVLRYRPAVGVLVLSLLGGSSLFWIYLSQTRAAVVGLLAAVGTMTLLFLLRGKGRFLRGMAAAVALACILLPAIVFFNRGASWVKKDPYLSRLSQSVGLDERLSAWRAGWAGILERPLFGWGPENYGCAFDSHFPTQIVRALQSESWFDRAHNFIIDVGTTTGVLGLALHLAVFLFALWLPVRRWFRTSEDPSDVILVALILAYLAQSLFTFDTLDTEITVFLILSCVASLFGGVNSDSVRASNSRRLGPAGWVAVIAALAVVLPAFEFTILKPSRANLELNRAVNTAYRLGTSGAQLQVVYSEEIVDLFQRANSHGTTGRYDVREEFARYAAELAAEPRILPEQKVRAVQDATSLLEESISQDPAYARRYLYFASFTRQSVPWLESLNPGLARTLAERSLDLLVKAEALSPSRPHVYYERAHALASLHRYDEAIASTEKALSLAPGIRQFRVDLVTYNIAASRDEAAAAAWQSMKTAGFQATRDDYDRVIRMYSARKRYTEVVALYEELLERNPQDAIRWARLATTYRELGELKEARQAATKAASLSPEVAAELQPFLDSLEKLR